MPIPTETLKVYEMTRIDLAIITFAKIENPSVNDINTVKCLASVEEGIDVYRAGATELSQADLKSEEHNSALLAKYMASAGDPRPTSSDYCHCHCHAMISGAHKRAAAQRAVMAWCMMRIDDPRNGCWLPRNTDSRKRMPDWLRNAIPHSRIHRKSYYFWLDQVININTIKNSEDLVNALRMVRTRLQRGALPVPMKREMKI